MRRHWEDLTVPDSTRITIGILRNPTRFLDKIGPLATDPDALKTWFMKYHVPKDMKSMH